MATSGTYTFTVTRDDIINSALRLIKAQSERDQCVGSRLINCSMALNIMVKSWVDGGLALWAVQDIAVPMVGSQSVYQIGPISSQPRPLRIMDAYIRNNSASTDVLLQVESRYDYDVLGSKSSPGVPNQLFYDPQLGNGQFTVYPVPVDSSYTVRLVIQRQFQDFNLATDNPDFPQEAFQALKWNLAAELYPELGDLSNLPLLQLITEKAKLYKDQMSAFWQEYATMHFTPSERRT